MPQSFNFVGYFIVSWWITQCVRLSSKPILNRMSYEFVTSFYFFLLPSVSNKKSFLCFLASQSLISLFFIFFFSYDRRYKHGLAGNTCKILCKWMQLSDTELWCGILFICLRIICRALLELLDYVLICPTLMKWRKTSFSISLPSSNLIISLILFTNMTLSTLPILTVCRTGIMNFVIDLGHWRVCG